MRTFEVHAKPFFILLVGQGTKVYPRSNLKYKQKQSVNQQMEQTWQNICLRCPSQAPEHHIVNFNL